MLCGCSVLWPLPLESEGCTQSRERLLYGIPEFVNSSGRNQVLPIAAPLNA